MKFPIIESLKTRKYSFRIKFAQLSHITKKVRCNSRTCFKQNYLKIVYSLEWSSLWSSSILSSRSIVPHIRNPFMLCPKCLFPVNFVGSNMFSTENANLFGVSFSLLSMLGFESIERVKSTGHVCGKDFIYTTITKCDNSEAGICKRQFSVTLTWVAVVSKWLSFRS